MIQSGVRSVRVLFFVGVAATALLSITSVAAAHSPAPVYFSMKIGEEEIVLTGTIGNDLFRDWTGVEPVGCADLEGDDLALARSRVESLFKDWAVVEVDGLAINPVFDSLDEVTYQDHQLEWKYITVKVAYGTKALPREVDFTWRRFENGINWWLEFIEGEIDAPGGGAYFEFTRDEPEYVWHAPREEGSGLEFRDPVFRQPVPWSIPVASLAVFLALIPGLFLFRKFRVSRAVAWPIVVVVLAAGTAGHDVGRIDVQSPWARKFEMPSEKEALYIFESLHRNIYRAFDYTTEDDIYETLARSVRGELLDQVYGEVYESLILRDQGGAVCKIQGTRILKSKVTIPEDENATWFFVDCVWQVRGKIGHWGHTHVRVNEYHAKYTVMGDGERWKISAVETLDQRRLPEEEAKATWGGGR